MEQKEIDNQRLLKIALGAGILGYGIARHKKLLALGLILYFSGVMKNFKIKEFIQNLTDKAFTIAEVNNLPIDDNDDSGGNGTGSPSAETINHAV